MAFFTAEGAEFYPKDAGAGAGVMESVRLNEVEAFISDFF